jgi:acyl-CoA synthetase (AMP-forming)/AMP-acid ligase II
MEVPELDRPPTLPALIAHAVATFGERDFIVMPDRRLSFVDAERASRRFAKQLLASGVGKGTRVGAIYPNGVEWVVSWLAAARIGALFMPFSSLYRPAELRRGLRYGDVSILLGPASMFGRSRVEFFEDAIAGLDAASATAPLRLSGLPYLRAVWLSGASDRAWAHPADLDPDGPEDDYGISDELLREVESEVTPADQMITIFTSGTTSEPKAVIYTHGAFVRHGANQARFRDLAGPRTDPNMFCSFPFFWIGGLGPINASFVTGERILCTERFEPEAVLQLMEREGSQQFAAWPPLVARLQQHIDTTGRDVSKIPAFQGPPPKGPRHLSLGMTETIGPHSAAGPEASRVLPEELRDSFGLPIPHIQMKIVDPETRQSLEHGSEGELCVRGYSLMDGLYKRERHTVFDDDGWYATGDKCLFRDGYVLFHGRLGDMIKTAGSNVAPREVEVVLQSFPDIALAMVAGIPDPEVGELVGAIVVPKSGVAVDPAELASRTSVEVSSYKVPRRWLVLAESEVPHLGNDKLDRLALRDLLIERGIAAG